MSLTEILEQFKGSTKVVINEKYIDDKGAKQIAKFFDTQNKIELIQLKSNDITSIGFALIFKALTKNINIRQINLQYNKLGEQSDADCLFYFNELMEKSPKLERINISNNKIKSKFFNDLASSICRSSSLKLFQVKYNQISTQQIQFLLNSLKKQKNQSLLYVELAGNKIDKETINKLENYLKQNRQKNPIPKDNLMMGTSISRKIPSQLPFPSQNSFSRNNIIDDLSKENVLRHLQSLLDQTRIGTTQMKNRLESQFLELQRKQKLDSTQIVELDKKCNQLTISNRNLNYEVERTLLQHKQIQQDHQYQAKIKEQRILEANKQLNQMQSKYEEIDKKMIRDHEAKIKQSNRVWELRLQSLTQKIRNYQAQTNNVDNQIRKISQKRDTLKTQYEQQQRNLRQRIQQEQKQKYKFKIQTLKSRLQEAEQSSDKFHKRSQQIIYEMQNFQNQGSNNISTSEESYEKLKIQQKNLVDKNKQFVSKNQSIKHEINLKNITIEKMQEQLNSIIKQMELRKNHNKQQVDKVIQDRQMQRIKTIQNNRNQIQKLGDLQAALRNYKLENAKLQQEYKLLEHKIQISLSRAVQQVFSQASLY